MTAEEYLKKKYNIDSSSEVAVGGTNLTKLMVEFAKHHVEKALQAAKEDFPCGGSDPIYCEDIDELIRDCYPKKNIK